jgi:threonine dehydratase
MQPPPTTSKLSLDRIAKAATTIDPVFRNSPQFLAEGLGARLGLRLVAKVEVVNPIRSFKGRGTDFFVQQLGADRTPLVCASAGNFGQGLAYAARKRGLSLHVFAAESANPLKVARMRAFGALVQLIGADFDSAKDHARDFAARQGFRFVEDGAEAAIAEGAGTMAVELAAWPEPFDAVYIPVGNGAMINGVGRWLKHVAPQTRIIGVGAVGSPAMERSWRSGTIVATDATDTIADGIATRVPVPLALREMALTVDDMVLVDDAAMKEAMALAFDEFGLVLEPSGASGIAAISAHRAQLQDQLVATILCGGNALEEHRRWLV